MKQWWLSLSLRDQHALSIGAIAVTIFLFYIMLWIPLDNKIISMRQHVQQNQKLLAWMQAADRQLQHVNHRALSTRLPASLLSIIQKQINKTMLAPQLVQLRQANSDAVQLSFKQVNFDRLIIWLTDTRQQGLTLTQLTVAPSETPGIVSAELQLTFS